MLRIRRAADRGRTDAGWLDSRHTFSFADYRDPAWMGFRALRVVNDDRVAPASGFETHFHRDMEIVSYVLEGALEHRDSLGNGSVIRAGDVQRMSAGTGVEHSEFNPSPTEPVHFLQLWIRPGRYGVAPSYEQTAFPAAERLGRWRIVASPDGREGSVRIHQDADVLLAALREGDEVRHALTPGRGAWLHVAHGRVVACGEALEAGDGIGVENVPDVVVSAKSAAAEVVLFDLA
jgi:hypothetical protein